MFIDGRHLLVTKAPVALNPDPIGAGRHVTKRLDTLIFVKVLDFVRLFHIPPSASHNRQGSNERLNP